MAPYTQRCGCATASYGGSIASARRMISGVTSQKGTSSRFVWPTRSAGTQTLLPQDVLSTVCQRPSMNICSTTRSPVRASRSNRSAKQTFEPCRGQSGWCELNIRTAASPVPVTASTWSMLGAVTMTSANIAEPLSTGVMSKAQKGLSSSTMPWQGATTVLSALLRVDRTTTSPPLYAERVHTSRGMPALSPIMPWPLSK
ncbi:PP21 [Orf virus]|uniref:PP21 n=1 Tax=Orf virus TaxID=10258 RepID=F1AXF3_ORFV|nr:PP21 [Orf virus]